MALVVFEAYVFFLKPKPLAFVCSSWSPDFPQNMFVDVCSCLWDYIENSEKLKFFPCFFCVFGDNMGKYFFSALE